MKTLSLKLTPNLDRKLAAAAVRRGATKSALVREAVEAYIRKDKSVSSGSCLDLAQDLIGCAEGPPDLSYKKKYLKGFGK